jgi:hypothetical protein
MLGADSRQAGNFILGEEFLSGLDCDHSGPSSAVTQTIQIRQEREFITPQRLFS